MGEDAVDQVITLRNLSEAFSQMAHLAIHDAQLVTDMSNHL